MVELIGRLHPVLVHLPIGIFIIALVMDLISRSVRFGYLEQSLRFVYSVGILGSVLSLVSGYFLSLEGNNTVESMQLHKWVAIGTTVLFTGYHFSRTKIIPSRLIHYTCIAILFSAMTATGHLGGSLTHGEDHLWAQSTAANETNSSIEITDIQEAVVYKEIVQHTLNVKCVQCHGEQRQKGKLRLDNQEWLEKGGKHGAVLGKDIAENSELIKRILLDINDEYHMPPKEKMQLTDFEIEIMKWWASAGAPFDKKVSAMMPDEKVKKSLNQFKEFYTSKNKVIKKERTPVAELNQAQKKELEQLGWVITPVSQEDHHLRVTGFNLEVPVTTALQELARSKAAVIELKLSGTDLKDGDLTVLSSFPLLEKLWLDHNPISNQSVEYINLLKQLEYINITETKIGTAGINALLTMPSLRTAYLSGQEIADTDIVQLKNKYSKINIDFGKDTMINVPTDTLFATPR